MRLLNLFGFALLASLFAGCAAYHLGPVNGETAGAKSITVLPFNNQTMQPRLGDDVTQAIRQRLQTDGTYHLTTDGEADLIVTGVITRYHRGAMSVLSHDAATPEDYRIDVTAKVTVRDRSSGKLILQKDVTGYSLVNIGSDLADAERQAAPLLAQDLAHNITSLITEGSW